ncbi:hypothetical protein P873_11100 [Arenimonas composti TR7-09 = DSM 18010]|uniref:Uncharacterized protein n=2 Tax=Arenimonas TaxID=490567 RepID=A0A091B9H5_9GAMM|nr:hypothetical protein P873_11100 [Arenimonas composti TR7-09 = DSM 18010]
MMPARPDPILPLALRYGTDLPVPPKLELALPAFAVGSVSPMRFSPDGAHLVVPTANGTFLWDVATGTKRLKLAVPSNPDEFAFSADGRELLVRGGAQFARLAMPSGELVAKFRAKEPLRLDGLPCLGPDAAQLLQLAAFGRVLAIDATSGRTIAGHVLDPEGCDGAVHWLADAGYALIAQRAVMDGDGRYRSGLWRWDPPFAVNAPQRLPGAWDHLDTAYLPARGELLLHHRPAGAGRDAYVLEVVDARTLAPKQRFACGAATRARAGFAHDGGAWSAAVDEGGVQIGLPDGVITWPLSIGSAAFSPVADLVALSGPLGLVAPRAMLPGLLASAQRQRDLDLLNHRGYARGTTWPGRQLPPRIVAWRGASGIGFEVEAIDGRKYVPLEGVAIAGSAAVDDIVTALASAITRAQAAALPGQARERRDFQAGALTAPPGDWQAGVAVTLASDAIDLWPLKAKKGGGFVQHWSPVAAIAAETRGGALWNAIAAMLPRPPPVGAPSGAMPFPKVSGKAKSIAAEAAPTGGRGVGQ